MIMNCTFIVKYALCLFLFILKYFFFCDLPVMTPAMTWWGKWAAMNTLDRQTQTWTPQKNVHSVPRTYLIETQRD